MGFLSANSQKKKKKGRFSTYSLLKLIFGKNVYSCLYTDIFTCRDSGEVELQISFFSPDCNWKPQPLDGRKSLFWDVWICLNPCRGCHDLQFQYLWHSALSKISYCDVTSVSFKPHQKLLCADQTPNFMPKCISLSSYQTEPRAFWCPVLQCKSEWARGLNIGLFGCIGAEMERRWITELFAQSSWYNYHVRG